MSETLLVLIVGSVCIVFIGTFIASVVIPGYQGAAVFAPVMTAAIGLVGGIALSKRANGGNGKSNGKAGDG